MLHIMICISRKDENGVLYLVINVILSSNDFSRFFTKKELSKKSYMSCRAKRDIL